VVHSNFYVDSFVPRPFGPLGPFYFVSI